MTNLWTKLNFCFLSLLGGKKGAIQRCPKCKGSGVYVKVHHIGPGFVQKVQSTCRACHGEGERINPKLKCKKCSGEKVQREQKMLEIIIDKGMCFLTFMCFWTIFLLWNGQNWFTDIFFVYEEHIPWKRTKSWESYFFRFSIDAVLTV